MIQKAQNLDFYPSGCIFRHSKTHLYIGWGTPQQASHPCEKGLSIYSPDFFLREPRPWWNFPSSAEVEIKELLSELEAMPESSFHGIQWNSPDFSQFSSAFSSLQKRFTNGELKKGVPVAFQTANLTLTPSLLKSFLRKLLTYTADLPLHVYGFWNSGEGILGATPELLFEQSKPSIVETMALAGTRLKSSHACSLFESTKDLEEHRLVIEGIRESLSDLGEILIDATQELELPTLSHLFTPIRLKLNSQERNASPSQIFTDLVRRLHPTPALGAFPKEAGMQWLASEESGEAGLGRGRFGAPLGMMKDQTEIRCLVAIRNLQWNQDQLGLGAGCGVISASRLEKEWEEILGKIESVQRIFFSS